MSRRAAQKTDCSCQCQWYKLLPASMLSSPFMSATKLLFLRTLYCLWNLPVLIACIIHYAQQEGDREVFATLSFLSYSLVNLYLVLILYITYKNRLLYKQAVSYSYDYIILLEDNNRLSTGQRIVWMLFEVLSVTALVVTCVYWIYLHPRAKQVNYLWSLHFHAANSLIMMTELFGTRMEFVPLHSLLMLVAAGGYFGWGAFYHSQTDDWIYSFLDYTASDAAGVYIAFFCGAVILFFFARSLTKLRDAIADKYCGVPEQLIEAQLASELNGSESDIEMQETSGGSSLTSCW